MNVQPPVNVYLWHKISFLTSYIDKLEHGFNTMYL